MSVVQTVGYGKRSA